MAEEVSWEGRSSSSEEEGGGGEEGSCVPEIQVNGSPQLDGDSRARWHEGRSPPCLPVRTGEDVQAPRVEGQVVQQAALLVWRSPCRTCPCSICRGGWQTPAFED